MTTKNLQQAGIINERTSFRPLATLTIIGILLCVIQFRACYAAHVAQKTTVKQGENLTTIFKRLHINLKDASQLGHQYYHIARSLIPTSHLSIQTNSHHQVLTLQYTTPKGKLHTFQRHHHYFTHRLTDQNPKKTKIAYKVLKIEHRLALSAKHAEVNAQMLAELEHMFRGKINFKKDLQPGDRFEFLYQRHLLAAEFIHHKKVIRIMRYTHHRKTGYYTFKGYPANAHFLPYPVKFTRISSTFSWHRLDPVIHKIRPHLGVDFAAKKGTPIRSIADGKIVFVGYDGGFGKTVKIRYGSRYLALYGHMSRFAHIRRSQHVHKGQIIGYVGSTGWATGPHLHFGFYINGHPTNWLAMKLPRQGNIIPAINRKHFFAKAKFFLNQLHFHHMAQWAANNREINHPT